MSLMGRIPLPTATKKERGTYKKSRGPVGEEPQPAVAILPPPPHLSARASEEWRKLVTELSRLGLFTVLDAGTLEAYCVFRDLARQAVEKLNEEAAEEGGSVELTMADALVITLPNNFSQANPLLDVIAKFYKLSVETGARFGLDPSSRSTKVRSPKKTDGEGNRLAALKEQRRKTA